MNLGGLAQAVGNAVGLGTRLGTKPNFPSSPRMSFNLYEEMDKALAKMRSTESQGSRDAQRSLANMTASLASGELPKEIEALVRRSAAEFGTASGLGISQTGARTARDLGLTGLDLQTRAGEMAQMVQAMELNRFNTARGSALDIANIKFKKLSIAMNHAYAKFAAKETRSREYAAAAAGFAGGVVQAFGNEGRNYDPVQYAGGSVSSSQTNTFAPGMGGAP